MSLVVETQSGPVHGAESNGARYWLGVPYASAERFGVPKSPVPWVEEKDATKYGPECPQFFGALATEKKIAGPTVDEDCLVLNIWTPCQKSDTPLPVMVWIHGGAFMTGSGNTYDGSKFASEKNIIVVSINYRLGILGFANFADAFGLDVPSNLGVRDQIAALEWVRDNIAAFGGDPQRVTIAGESAGSLAISMLLINETQWPLFHGAIMQSGALSLFHAKERSQRIAEHYKKVLGEAASSLEALRALDISTLLHAQIKAASFEEQTVPAAPWYDGDVFPTSLEEARAKTTHNVPLLVGYNQEEIRLFEVIKGKPILPMAREDSELLVREQLSAEAANQLLSAYPNDKAGNRLLATHITFGMPTMNFAEEHAKNNDTWCYRFDFKHPLLGAAHAVELGFVWPFKGLFGIAMRGGLLWGKRKALAERMQAHWAHFVHHGKPLDNWPQYSHEDRKIYRFSSQDEIVDDPDKLHREAWDGAYIITAKQSSL
ncbi:carboxylesterase/lipase family protein [Aurantivibrio plasticivorans]